VADTFVQYLDNGGNHSFSERSGGATGSLFGLKGDEDLGGGLTAQFDVETGFNINNGSLFADTNALFYRQAWVGLNDSKYGSLTMGRQYEPSFRVVYPTDPYRANEVLSPFSAAVLTVDRKTLSTQYDSGRASNSILYQSPNMGGLQLYGMYAFAATVTQPVPATTGNMLNLGASYTGYGLYAGLAYVNQHPGQETIAGLPTALSPCPYTEVSLLPSSRNKRIVSAAMRTVVSPFQMVSAPGSPSPLRARNPPRRAMSRNTSLSLDCAGARVFVSR
jgi:GBP family porin